MYLLTLSPRSRLEQRAMSPCHRHAGCQCQWSCFEQSVFFSVGWAPAGWQPMFIEKHAPLQLNVPITASHNKHPISKSAPAHLRHIRPVFLNTTTRFRHDAAAATPSQFAMRAYWCACAEFSTTARQAITADSDVPPAPPPTIHPRVAPLDPRARGPKANTTQLRLAAALRWMSLLQTQC